jgi:hypothetical protein
MYIYIYIVLWDFDKSEGLKKVIECELLYIYIYVCVCRKNYFRSICICV